MGAMTRLDAVNQMLLYAGEMVVSDLAGDSGIDTSIAEFLLDSKTQDYQQRGLAENQMVVQVSADTNGRIAIRTDALDVEMINPPKAVTEPQVGQSCRVVTRGGYLYNLTDDTDIFPNDNDQKYNLNYIVEMDWDDMATSIQKAITMQAAREYQMMSNGDAGTDQYLAQLEQKYTAKAKGEDAKDKAYSILYNGTIPVLKMLYGRQQYYNPDGLRFGPSDPTN
jgi:hypothetical protein